MSQETFNPGCCSKWSICRPQNNQTKIERNRFMLLYHSMFCLMHIDWFYRCYDFPRFDFEIEFVLAFNVLSMWVGSASHTNIYRYIYSIWRAMNIFKLLTSKSSIDINFNFPLLFMNLSNRRGDRAAVRVKNEWERRNKSQNKKKKICVYFHLCHLSVMSFECVSRRHFNASIRS